jgi:phosphate starvation-inducible protein PhoH and related proteins
MAGEQKLRKTAILGANELLAPAPEGSKYAVRTLCRPGAFYGLSPNPLHFPSSFRSRLFIFSSLMKSSVQISRGIESLFGTRDENIRLLESELNLRTRLLDGDSLELEGEDQQVQRAEEILEDYVSLVMEGHVFNNGDLNSYLRVVTADRGASLRRLVESGKSRAFGKKVLAPKTVNQRRYVDAIEHHDLTIGIGPAGTGKTYLAVAMAVSALLNKRVSRIVLTRPAVEAGEHLGFLPGTLQEKVDPYLRPLYDALFDMIDAERVEKLIERNVIEIAPLAFMRGRTLNDCFIILDEAQNTTVEQMKMILTRQGFNSKMVVNGDQTQIDLPAGRKSGLLNAAEVLKGVEGIAFVNFDERDVVRHALVQRIVKAYDRYNEMTGMGRQLALRLGSDAPQEASAEPPATSVEIPEFPSLA